ncbi:neprosin family prolyl endopeptidase [Actinoplanes sp. NPDC051494]|uniref:neprosin family prolyl endopeptidase n=1 Tax=Actinoplanes sp. NPDC051494 TaxID=3363907 RepID=UPI00379017F7
MSKSRRGLLAAGLAAAVVGATGVVWTLNASAAETPAVETPAAEAAATDAVEPDAAALAVPPKLLPWGERPTTLKRARAGADSEAVAAAGADAAPADTSGSLLPVPEYGPKGTTADTVPPTPPTAGRAASDVVFHYAVGSQTGATDGSWANLSIATPELDTDDYHTLTEIAVRSADEQQTVEVGWNVDRTVNGDADPHLFVFYWKDGVPTCYNACGFQQYSSTVKPGDTLPTGEAKRFGVQHSAGNWWIAYDSEWVGYFPDRLWDGRYTRAGFTQWFGEVAASSAAPCTDMGNGQPASSGTAARVGSISMTEGPEPIAAVETIPRNSPYYSVDRRSDRTFRFGGAGAC